MVGNFLSGSGILTDTMITAISASGLTTLMTVDNNKKSFTADMTSTSISVHGFEEVTGHPTCNLQYWHLPVAQNQTLGEYSACHSYQSSSEIRAVSKSDLLTSWSKMNELYGDE